MTTHSLHSYGGDGVLPALQTPLFLPINWGTQPCVGAVRRIGDIMLLCSLALFRPRSHKPTLLSEHRDAGGETASLLWADSRGAG